MRSTFAFTAVTALALQGVAATGWRAQQPYGVPQNYENKCTENEHKGWDWSDLPQGNFDQYKDYNFSGWKCGTKQGKRSLEGRNFNSKCITAEVKEDEFTNEIRCDQKDFSIGHIDVSIDDEDQDVEFHYEMKDGSNCKKVQRCGPGGTTVKNDQCGGATKVKVKIPKQKNNNGNKKKCNVNFHSVKFECGSSTTSVPVPTSTIPANNDCQLPSYCGGKTSPYGCTLPSHCEQPTTAPEPSAPSSAPAEPSSAPADEPSSAPVDEPSSAAPSDSVSSAAPSGPSSGDVSSSATIPDCELPSYCNGEASGENGCSYPPSCAAPSSAVPSASGPSSVPAVPTASSSAPSDCELPSYCNGEASGENGCSYPPSCAGPTEGPSSDTPAGPSETPDASSSVSDVTSSAPGSSPSSAPSDGDETSSAVSSASSTTPDDCELPSYCNGEASGENGCSYPPSCAGPTSSAGPSDTPDASSSVVDVSSSAVVTEPSSGPSDFPSGSVTSEVPTGPSDVPSGSVSSEVPAGPSDVPSGSVSSEVPAGPSDVPYGSVSSELPAGPSDVPSASSVYESLPSGGTEVAGTPSPTGEVVVPTPNVPAPPTECPDSLPKCLNTWLFITECKDNANPSCYCPSAEFVEKVEDCLYAYSQDDAEVAKTVEYFLGLCNKYIPENPAIIDFIPPVVEFTEAAPIPNVPVETIIRTITNVVPCEPTTLTEGPSSGEVVSTTTEEVTQTIAIPQVTLIVTATDADLVYPTVPAAGATQPPAEVPAAPTGAPSVPAGPTTLLTTGVSTPTVGAGNATTPLQPSQEVYLGAASALVPAGVATVMGAFAVLLFQL